MANAINLAALRLSLLSEPVPRRVRDGDAAGVSAARGGASDPTPPADKLRGKRTIERLHAMAYPESLVSGNRGVPATLQAGLARRHRAARAVAAARTKHPHGTPERVSQCAAAAAAADAALERYHEARTSPGGDEDGTLQDVVDLSLAKDQVCVVDVIWDKTE